MRTKAITRLLFTVGVITWLALVLADVSLVFGSSHNIPAGIAGWLPNVLLSLFIVALYYYYRLRYDRDDALNFVDLLWRVFATGLVATVVSLFLKLVEFLFGTTTLPNNPVFIDLIYLINLGLMIGFLIMAFTAWKRLILYQKSKWLLRLWNLFESSLLVALIFNALDFPFIKEVYWTMLVVLVIMGMVLSANMKWVAYLNFRQKWTGLLLLLLTVFYLLYISFTTSAEMDLLMNRNVHFTNYRENVTILALMAFVLMYAIFSFLVILFNLPTTSVFEQKLEEVVNFQRISQSIQTEQSEDSVYNILLETSVSTVFADAAWLEVKGQGDTNKIFTYRMTEREVHEITDHLKIRNIKGIFDQGSDRTRHLSNHLATLRGSRFRSILAFQIPVKGQNIGMLALLKELPDGFNREMTKIVATFANQAGISIENFRLLEEALQNERYKEELKIAKMVQKSLLPQDLESDPDFEIAAFSESPDEVGGDYYDTLRADTHKVAMIVADVSGKGTTAAFHMSQMKGIFHSLAQECVEPDIFMQKANQALVYCLERGSFISATFFIVNTREKKVHYARAGHCPVLVYHAADNHTQFFRGKGIALGMVRNKSYSNYIRANSFDYRPGDIMVLYTDGITEAKNGVGEEFGYERLAEVLLEVKNESAKRIQEHMINRLYEFTGTSNINDDYTTVVVKFT